LIFFIDFSSKDNTQNILVSENRELKEIEYKDIDTILIFAESLRADFFYSKEFTPKLNSIKYLKLSKPIYSLATSTDVTIPLFINQSRDTSKIYKEFNLFKLASKNSFHTAFISAQSSKSLKYIEEYLSLEYIKDYKTSNNKDDKFLLENLKDLNNKDNNFIVLQMIGQHSPYSYYPKEFNFYNSESKILNSYKNSIRYSDFILCRLISNLLDSNKKRVIILTSDHGEILGVDGKYGHNQFDKRCYIVPLDIYSNFDINLPNIDSHYELSRYISKLIGFENLPNISSTNEIIINGSMISGEDGYIMVKKPTFETSQ
jgi:glucan phosphoethanolaminetransferase (alkaline phosphatase superfamily)